MKHYEIIECPASCEAPGTVDPDDGRRVIWVRAESIRDVTAALASQAIRNLPDAIQSVKEINLMDDPSGLDLEILHGEVTERPEPWT